MLALVMAESIGILIAGAAIIAIGVMIAVFAVPIVDFRKRAHRVLFGNRLWGLNNYSLRAQRATGGLFALFGLAIIVVGIVVGFQRR